MKLLSFFIWYTSVLTAWRLSWNVLSYDGGNSFPCIADLIFVLKESIVSLKSGVSFSYSPFNNPKDYCKSWIASYWPAFLSTTQSINWLTLARTSLDISWILSKENYILILLKSISKSSLSMDWAYLSLFVAFWLYSFTLFMNPCNTAFFVMT